jgi:hypothetical protein
MSTALIAVIIFAAVKMRHAHDADASGRLTTRARARRMEEEHNKYY